MLQKPDFWTTAHGVNTLLQSSFYPVLHPTSPDSSSATRVTMATPSALSHNGNGNVKGMVNYHY